MKVLILGGTTFFGREIVRAFHEAGHQPTVFTRGNRPLGDLPPCAQVHGDRRKAEDLRRLGKFRWDVVIDNLAFSGEDVRLILGELGQVGRYLLTSTVSIYRYARPFQQPLLEGTVDFDRAPAGEDLSDIHWSYARGKWEAEKVLRAQKSIPWTIFRPTVVYGPHDPKERGWWYFARMRKGGPLLLANSGAASFRLVYSRDVARAYVQAADTVKTVGRTYNLAQNEIITLRQFIEDSAKTLGVTPELVDIPRSRLGELIGPHDDLINFVPDYGAAVRDFGFQPTAWSEVAAACARWFRDEWRGDEAALLATREKELELARRWKAAMESLPAARPS